MLPKSLVFPHLKQEYLTYTTPKVHGARSFKSDNNKSSSMVCVKQHKPMNNIRLPDTLPHELFVHTWMTIRMIRMSSARNN
jgi:hypothetical protein